MRIHTGMGVALAFLLGIGEASPCNAADPTAASTGPNVVIESVLSDADLHRAMNERLETEAYDRRAVLDLLARPEARAIAGAAGLDVVRAEAAARTLSGPELRNLADRARLADFALAGGDTVVISLTGLIIILLIILLIAD